MTVVVLFGLAGILAGGAVSIHRQGASKVAVVIMVVLAALAFAGGALRLWGD